MGPNAKDTSKEVTSKDSTKEALLAAAKKVFGEKGFAAATVKEIADAAGVNVSLVSYHFQGKEKLYHACLFGFAEKRMKSGERYFKGPENFEDLRTRLSLFAEDMLLDGVADPDICRILHRDCIGVENPILNEIFLSSFVKNFELFVAFLTEAQKKKILRADMDLEICASQFMGGLVHSIRFDQLRQQIRGESIADQAFRDRLVKYAVEMMLNGTKA